MTPHEKALEAAISKFDLKPNYIERMVYVYFTTLLDSPEMVDALHDALDEAWKEGAVVRLSDSVDAVIAAIKKEAGIL